MVGKFSPYIDFGMASCCVERHLPLRCAFLGKRAMKCTCALTVTRCLFHLADHGQLEHQPNVHEGQRHKWDTSECCGKKKHILRLVRNQAVLWGSNPTPLCSNPTGDVLAPERYILLPFLRCRDIYHDASLRHISFRFVRKMEGWLFPSPNRVPRRRQSNPSPLRCSVPAMSPTGFIHF